MIHKCASEMPTGGKHVYYCYPGGSNIPLPAT